jgi:Beta-lactamase
MEDYAEVRLVKILHKLGLTEEMAWDHVMLPDHVKAAAALHIELHDVGDGDDDPSNPPPPSGLFYRLNVQKLSRNLNNLLSGCVAGYSMHLRRYGQTIFDEQWNWAKKPWDGNVHWASDVPMHVASVSKLITAVAMTKLLYSRNISPDAHILPWLPKYWHKGPGVDRITFRQLLTHTSGLVLVNQPGPSDFQFMKDQIALGTVGKPGYRNMNFGLCRILISTNDAPFLFDWLSPGVTDAYWDLTTIRYYARYVSENIFVPAGVTSTFDHIGNNALAYPYPANVPGWRSGDLSTMSGCVAWHLRRFAIRTPASCTRYSQRSRTILKAFCSHSRSRLSACSRHLRCSGECEQVATDGDRQQAPPPSTKLMFILTSLCSGARRASFAWTPQCYVPRPLMRGVGLCYRTVSGSEGQTLARNRMVKDKWAI